MVRSAILATLVAAIGLAVLMTLAVPSKAQDRPSSDNARYRFAVVRVTMPADSDGAPLTLGQVAEASRPSLKFDSEKATAAGYFGALQYPHDLVKRLGALGPTEVISRGELEGAPGDTCTLNAGREFPVQVRETRGDQVIVTTRFQKVGSTVEVRALGKDQHDVNLSFSAVSAWSEGGQPVIYTASSKGRLILPDGFTAVFDFLDRVDAESITRPVQERVTDQPQEREERRHDVVVRFVLLLTRLDLAPR